MGESLSSFESKIKVSKKEFAEIEEKKAKLYEEYESREKEVQQFSSVKKELLKLGFSIMTLTQSVNFLTSMEQNNGNPRQILAKIEKIGALDSRKMELQGEIEKSKSEQFEIQGRLKETQNLLAGKEKVLAKLKRFEDMGFSLDQLEDLRNTIISAATKHGIFRPQALARFEDNVLKNYDSSLVSSQKSRLWRNKRSQS